MYENVVIEFRADVLGRQEVRGVCAGAAHQIRMITEPCGTQPLVFFMFPFLFRCAPCVLLLSSPLSPSRSPHVLCPTPVLAPGMKPKHGGKCAA